MNVSFTVTLEMEAQIEELGRLRGIDSETLLHVLAFFGLKRELNAQLHKARLMDINPTSIDRSTATKPLPAPVDWAAAMRAYNGGEATI